MPASVQTALGLAAGDAMARQLQLLELDRARGIDSACAAEDAEEVATVKPQLLAHAAAVEQALIGAEHAPAAATADR